MSIRRLEETGWIQAVQITNSVRNETGGASALSPGQRDRDRQHQPVTTAKHIQINDLAAFVRSNCGVRQYTVSGINCSFSEYPFRGSRFPLAKHMRLIVDKKIRVFMIVSVRRSGLCG